MKAKFTEHRRQSPTRHLIRTFLMKVHRRYDEYFNRDDTIVLKDLDRHKGWEIGEYSYGNMTKSPKIVYFGEECKLKIGNYCSFGEDVWIVLGGEHRTDWVTTYPFSVLFDGAEDIPGHPRSKGDIVIGNDVWVCTGAMIMSGVTVGNGAVIAARSVVTKDVSPYTIVAGNPARPINKRFPDDLIEGLEQIKWWDWPVEKIRGEFSGMLTANVKEFVDKHREKR